MDHGTSRLWPVAMLLFAICACGPKEANESEHAKEVSVQFRDSLLTQENTVLHAQKDSIFLEARNLFEAISAIDSATALAGVRAPKHGRSEPLQRYEDQVRLRTVKALRRLRDVEARLKASVAKVDRIGGENEQLRTEANSLRATAVAMQAQVNAQQARVDTLMQQLAVVQGRADSLQGKTQQLGTTIDSMVTESHRVYVVSGNKNYLLKHKIVEEVGGTRFPFIVKVGTTLRPANVDPDTTLFRSFDMLNGEVIPLDSTKRYEVVSVQDLVGADRGNAKGRVFRGSIHIADPQRFWKPSAYLILREL